MSLQAYQSAAQRAENPRETEYRLFGEVTRALMDAAKAEETDIQTRIHALDWNRRMWSALASDCVREDNALAPQLRASIISLSLWVGKHSSGVMRHEEAFEPLIEINRIVMQGLAPQTQQAA
jgi:flagellar biosynthesis activator protein FlaF